MPDSKILVIEDADATRRLIELSLSLDGFTVLQRLDGPSGLAAVQEFLPDVVVLDVALPGFDGWEVLRRIRGDVRTERVPVVIITAHDTAETRSQAELSHANAFVGKPFDVNHLRGIVFDLIREGTP